MKSLSDFECELAQASTLEEEFKVVFEGLILNTFTIGLGKINQLNLPTLEIRYPEIYETVKDKSIREVLIKIGMFDVDVFKNPDKEAVELGRPMVDKYGALIDALNTIGTYRFQEHFKTAFGWIDSVENLDRFYGGRGAVKVFLKALWALCMRLCRSGDEYAMNEEDYIKLKSWLKLDEIEYVTHKRRIERGIRRLGPICRELERRKRTVKKKLGLALSS